MRVFFIFLKSHILNRAYVAACMAAFVFLLILSGARLPEDDHVHIGICTGANAAAEELLNLLRSRESIFIYEEYDDADSLISHVKSGRLECGFIMGDDFTGEIGAEGEIIFASTPFSPAALSARETVSEALLRFRTGEILRESAGEIFVPTGDIPEELLPEIISMEESLEGSGDIFDISVETLKVNDDSTRGEASLAEREHGDGTKNSSLLLPLDSICRNLTALFIFIMMYVNHFSGRGTGKRAVFSSLDVVRRRRAVLLDDAADGVIPMALGMVLVLCRGMKGEGSGYAGALLPMILIWLLTALWLMALDMIISLIPFGMSEGGSFPAMICINLLVCPVVADMSKLLPALSVVKYMLPMGWIC